MGAGKDPTNHDPADTDTAGFLQLIINCRLFANRLVEAKVKSVSCVFYSTPWLLRLLNSVNDGGSAFNHELSMLSRFL